MSILRRAKNYFNSLNLHHGLTIYGFLDSANGIGHASRSYANAFEKTGLSLNLISIPDGRGSCELSNNPYRHTNIKTDTALLILNADFICHLIEVKSTLRKSYNLETLPPELKALCKSYNKKVSTMFWELPVFPKRWIKAFDELDEIWVSSNFIKESLSSVTRKPINVIPIAVPLNPIDKFTARLLLNLPRDKTIYLVTFDFNSYPERKNAIGAIKAYCDAFIQGDNSETLLLIKCHGQNNRNDYLIKIQEIIQHRTDVTILDRTFSQLEMNNLQASIDVYVSLHRSEGYGLNIAECMAAGKIVVATGFSGNMEFMNDQNSIPINYSIKNVGINDYLETDGQWWAEPDHDMAVNALKHTFLNYSRLSYLAANARKTVEYELSYDKIGELMKLHL